MPALKSLSDENRRQISEDESLNECNQYFDQVNEYSEQDRQRGKAPAGHCAHGPKYENQRDETENDDVPGYHVGEQTDYQGKGLCENTQQFYREHDQHPYHHRNTRIPEYMSPEMFVGAEDDHKK